ncbi:MAG: hypothetical protein AAF335_03035 [Bacteroidota bacterium]
MNHLKLLLSSYFSFALLLIPLNTTQAALSQQSTEKISFTTCFKQENNVVFFDEDKVLDLLSNQPERINPNEKIGNFFVFSYFLKNIEILEAFIKNGCDLFQPFAKKKPCLFEYVSSHYPSLLETAIEVCDIKTLKKQAKYCYKLPVLHKERLNILDKLIKKGMINDNEQCFSKYLLTMAASIEDGKWFEALFKKYASKYPSLLSVRTFHMMMLYGYRSAIEKFHSSNPTKYDINQPVTLQGKSREPNNSVKMHPIEMSILYGIDNSLNYLILSDDIQSYLEKLSPETLLKWLNKKPALLHARIPKKPEKIIEGRKKIVNILKSSPLYWKECLERTKEMNGMPKELISMIASYCALVKTNKFRSFDYEEKGVLTYFKEKDNRQ